jgi:hypothetical protein
VVRLPVAHCQLNPIELAWAQVKNYIKQNNRAFNLTEVEKLAWKGFEKVTANDWQKLIEHVKVNFEDHYWANDGLYEDLIEDFTISVSGSESESSDSDTDED